MQFCIFMGRYGDCDRWSMSYTCSLLDTPFGQQLAAPTILTDRISLLAAVPPLCLHLVPTTHTEGLLLKVGRLVAISGGHMYVMERFCALCRLGTMVLMLIKRIITS